MSTILDALRKSEQERKLNKLPTLTDVTAPQEPSRWPVYLGLALVVLAIALVILAYVIWSAKPNSAQASNDNAGVITAEAEVADSKATTQEAAVENGSAKANDSMQVNVVSYSEDPELRFAMVNGKLVREGEFIKPGLKVEKIQSDAVVFNARGKKITRSP